MKYKVRAGFWLHGIGADAIGPGEVVDLTAEQAAARAHQIEPVDPLDHDGDGKRGGSVAKRGRVRAG